MTAPQFAILDVLITYDEDFDQATIGQRLGLDSSTGSYLIKRLERDKLVATVVDPDNRRRKLITITEKGLDLVRGTMPDARAAEDLILARLTPSEQAQLKHLLRRLVGVDADDELTGDGRPESRSGESASPATTSARQ
ncbi:MarR family winged helix-turn-helix transcriptional regulator [Pseudonocardia sp. CA-142604]|uniref:MarR family winged helix-turn-helix transcriptional regulator n=1 Tax=Pseudonocardia sp. CA-142604 TaxID=3240024 RepID=UPI003D93A3BE